MMALRSSDPCCICSIQKSSAEAFSCRVGMSGCISLTWQTLAFFYLLE